MHGSSRGCPEQSGGVKLSMRSADINRARTDGHGSTACLIDADDADDPCCSACVCLYHVTIALPCKQVAQDTAATVSSSDGDLIDEGLLQNQTAPGGNQTSYSAFRKPQSFQDVQMEICFALVLVSLSWCQVVVCSAIDQQLGSIEDTAKRMQEKRGQQVKHRFRAAFGVQIVYCVNVWLGRRTNSDIALAWAGSFCGDGGVLDRNFAQIGIGGQEGNAVSSLLLQLIHGDPVIHALPMVEASSCKHDLCLQSMQPSVVNLLLPLQIQGLSISARIGTLIAVYHLPIGCCLTKGVS